MVKILVILAIVVVLAIVMPIATIWSLNTLFPVLAIPITFDTWIATIVLGGVVGGSTGLSFGSKK
jgi:hypothetical protein